MKLNLKARYQNHEGWALEKEKLAIHCGLSFSSPTLNLQAFCLGA